MVVAGVAEENDSSLAPHSRAGFHRPIGAGEELKPHHGVSSSSLSRRPYSISPTFTALVFYPLFYLVYRSEAFSKALVAADANSPLNGTQLEHLHLVPKSVNECE
ncbi:hypothetical protein ANTPLA_LOCUS5792 [Anthophora plagiata]